MTLTRLVGTAACLTALLTTSAIAPASASTPSAPSATANQRQIEHQALRIAAHARTVKKRVVADYTAESKNAGYTPDKIPYQDLTHIIYAGLSYGPDGTLTVPANFLSSDLIKRAHRAHVKVLLLVGGAIDQFSSHPHAAATAVAATRRIVQENHFDGVDLDWEFPADATQTTTEISLLRGFRSALGGHALISMDVAPWTIGSYAVPTAAKIVDWFNVMTYDCAGPWTANSQLNAPILPLRNDPVSKECNPGQSAAESISLMLRAGARPAQLNQGTPFYGYKYATVDGLWKRCPSAATTADHTCGDAAVSTVEYRDIPAMLASGTWIRHVQSSGLVPYLTKKDGSAGFVTYDDARSTYDRVLYSVWTRHLGGTFTWELSGDWSGNQHPLLHAMALASRARPLR